MKAAANFTLDENERSYFDFFSAILLFVTALGGAWLPKYLCSHGASDTLSSSSFGLAFHLGNMLSAGVMLSAGFCHLLADAHRHILFAGRFPLANFLAACGYIITLVADQVVQAVSEANAASSSVVAGGGAGEYRKLPAAELTSALARSNTDTGLTTAVHREGHHHHRGSNGSTMGSGDPEAGEMSHSRSSGALNGAVGGGGAGVSGAGGAGSSVKQPLLADLRSGAGDRDSRDDGAGRMHSVTAATKGVEDCHVGGVAVLLGAGGRKLSFATAVLLAAALCIHSILEGMALGAQVSMRSTEDIMMAIAAHKGLAAYALGASIVESGASSTRFWTVIGLFAAATPLGILMGYGLSSSANSKPGAALSALASGTFLYVAFMEVIPKELADGKNRLLKMGVFLLGYGLMSLLAVWA
ncbi:hypothetical protein CHLRE_06g299600v5 [Chlamydomonas reinhardtii]|uniref:Uncharacterized protein n=1 Tax=Chlamydomonas reinhardtii TaxID=3055 RepID=A8INX4_CHLRE|nr:uncharacterized protein CHLRE_06g299600v5 [Chlamydomonas reinhardtii]PNW82918.1 hypothetical protein CHLRE_06g299600v5 [Chlamydomonas reinhardtii]|eukprot:XP_001691291.1 ZIP family transporter [Chlamydomonas reinhardtii]